MNSVCHDLPSSTPKLLIDEGINKNTAGASSKINFTGIQTSVSQMKEDQVLLKKKTTTIEKQKTTKCYENTQIILKISFSESLPITLGRLMTIQTTLQDKINSNIENYLLRYQLFQNSISTSALFRNLKNTLTDSFKLQKANEKEEGFFNQAQEQCEAGESIDPLNALNFFMRSIMQEFQGIDCQKLSEVEKYIKSLKTAQILDPESEEIRVSLCEAIQILKNRWKELETEGFIEESTYTSNLENLTAWLQEDHLKNLFINNPSYFNLPKTQYSSFFEAHPDFVSIEAFREKYPEVNNYSFSHETTVAEAREFFAQKLDCPFTTSLMMFDPTTPILTREIADQIKDGMLKFFAKGKMLDITFGNEKDRETLVQSFKQDKNLEDGALILPLGEHHIFSIAISPQHPYTIKK